MPCIMATKTKDTVRIWRFRLDRTFEGTQEEAVLIIGDNDRPGGVELLTGVIGSIDIFLNNMISTDTTSQS